MPTHHRQLEEEEENVSKNTRYGATGVRPMRSFARYKKYIAKLITSHQHPTNKTLNEPSIDVDYDKNNLSTNNTVDSCPLSTTTRASVTINFYYCSYKSSAEGKDPLLG